uniref:Death domain-containing protein n=1 Tax=Amphimedon queenslandica TaxID=400682 RepID=A0A1X7TB85_AMPQE
MSSPRSSLPSHSRYQDFIGVSDEELSIDDFDSVYEAVRPLSALWKSIAISLRLRISTINRIEDYDYERHGIPCWRRVCVAVKEGGGDPALADEIARKHPLPATTGGATPHPLPPLPVAFINVSDKELSIDDFYSVYDKVRPLSACWRQIAISLRLRIDTINRIETNSRGDAISCLQKVIEYWLKKDYDYERHGAPCWRRVCVAVKEGGGDPALADEIAREHPLPATTGGATPHLLPTTTGGATPYVSTSSK